MSSIAIICVLGTLPLANVAHSDNSTVPAAPAVLVSNDSAVPTALEQKQDAWIHSVSMCEDPTQDPNIVVLDTNNRYSYGVLQFQMSTWIDYGVKYGIPTSAANINDAALQIELAKMMLADGAWENWYICGQRTIAKLGPYPTM